MQLDQFGRFAGIFSLPLRQRVNPLPVILVFFALRAVAYSLRRRRSYTRTKTANPSKCSGRLFWS